MSTPTPGADPDLPSRLRALRIITDGERRTGRAWFAAARRFFDRIRPAVTGGPVINPAAVTEAQPFWTDAVNVEIIPTVAVTMEGMFQRITGDPAPEGDPFVAEYLNEAGNRLVRFPDEVYALVVKEVERGITDGDDIDTVTQRIDQLLTVTGSERWRNRARTVARTETMGAVNAGAYRSAQLEAEDRDDEAPFKMWLSTLDDRTRPTHREADQQRTLLDSPFRVGGSDLLFPGDPRGPAGEVINCRCTVLPIVLGETIDWTNRQYEGGDA